MRGTAGAGSRRAPAARPAPTSSEQLPVLPPDSGRPPDGAACSETAPGPAVDGLRGSPSARTTAQAAEAGAVTATSVPLPATSLDVENGPRRPDPGTRSRAAPPRTRTRRRRSSGRSHTCTSRRLQPVSGPPSCARRWPRARGGRRARRRRGPPQRRRGGGGGLHARQALRVATRVRTGAGRPPAGGSGPRTAAGAAAGSTAEAPGRRRSARLSGVALAGRGAARPRWRRRPRRGSRPPAVRSGGCARPAGSARLIGRVRQSGPGRASAPASPSTLAPHPASAEPARRRRELAERNVDLGRQDPLARRRSTRPSGTGSTSKSMIGDRDRRAALAVVGDPPRCAGDGHAGERRERRVGPSGWSTSRHRAAGTWPTAGSTASCAMASASSGGARGGRAERQVVHGRDGGHVHRREVEAPGTACTPR